MSSGVRSSTVFKSHTSLSFAATFSRTVSFPMYLLYSDIQYVSNLAYFVCNATKKFISIEVPTTKIGQK